MSSRTPLTIALIGLLLGVAAAVFAFLALLGWTIDPGDCR